MLKRLNHFHAYDWLGHFYYASGGSSDSFPGKLTYKAETGLILEFFHQTSIHAKKNDLVYGVLQNGELCTLFYARPSDSLGYHYGKVSISQGKYRFDFGVFGRHILESDTFEGIWADFTNFQEFCHPQGFKHLAKLSTQPIQSDKKGRIEVSVNNNASLQFVGRDLANNFYSANPAAMAALEEAFQAVEKKYPNEIDLRTDIGWVLEVRDKTGLNVKEAIAHASAIEGLLSLLLFKAVRRTEVTLMSRAQEPGFEGKHHALPLLISMFNMDAHKASVVTEEIVHFHSPITLANFNLAKAILTWLENKESFELFVGIINSSFGRFSQHEIYAEIILLLVQIEAISIGRGYTKAGEKYSSTLGHYGNAALLERLCSILLAKDIKDLGVKLSDLRAEIAHVGRTQVLLKRLGLGQILTIMLALRTVIASHIYALIGVEPGKIDDFQKKFLF